MQAWGCLLQRPTRLRQRGLGIRDPTSQSLRQAGGGAQAERREGELAAARESAAAAEAAAAAAGERAADAQAEARFQEG